jgi:hypothetical protein
MSSTKNHAGGHYKDVDRADTFVQMNNNTVILLHQRKFLQKNADG